MHIGGRSFKKKGVSICKVTNFYTMFIFHHIKDLEYFLNPLRKEGRTIGFVPTMGALHEGHISLVQAAQQHADVVVCSIYVNPTQFNNKEDFAKYPKTLEADVLKLELAGCNVLFLPIEEEMYPEGTASLPYYELGSVAEVLEGAYRPGHFQGVAAIVDTLLRIVAPHSLFMGQKDYQQCMVVAKLIALRGHATALHVVPIKREPDGLAMSSRNVRLTEGERQLASLLYQCLVSAQAQVGQKRFSVVQLESQALLEKKGIQLEYMTLCNATTLELLQDYEPSTPMVVLIAAYLGKVRLIDNLVL